MKTLFLLLVSVCYAAVPADAVFQVQTVGSSDVNCGGWSAANGGATGVDHSQSGGTAFTSTLSGSAGSPTLTDSGAGFLNTMLGNCVKIAGQGTYFITAFLTTSTVTVDRNLGTFSTTSGHQGDPIASSGALCAATLVSGNTAYFKNDGTFSLTTASLNANAGPCSSTANAIFVGYTSNRTILNTDAAATIQNNVAGATTATCGGSAGITYRNFIFDGNNQTTAKAFAGCNFINVAFQNYKAASSGTVFLYNVSVTGSSAAVITLNNGGGCFYCEAYANTATPFVINANVACVFCQSYSNTGATTDGFLFSSNIAACFFCTAYANGRDGFRSISNSVMSLMVNTYAESNVADGYNLAGTTAIKFALGLGYFGNGTDISAIASTVLTTAITPASSAFVSATNLNTNNTAGAGNLLRDTAVPATFLRGLTPSYMDVNAAHHQDFILSNTTIGTPTVQ